MKSLQESMKYNILFVYSLFIVTVFFTTTNSQELENTPSYINDINTYHNSNGNKEFIKYGPISLSLNNFFLLQYFILIYLQIKHC